jgi:hypothetical protein
VRTLVAIKSNSSLRETSYNCPGEPTPNGFAPHREPTPLCRAAHFG